MAGVERTCIPVASLVDTNVLVYRFDPSEPEKQRIRVFELNRHS